VASLLLGVLNALLRPLLLILSLPLVVLSLGLFVLVINALLLGFVGQLVKGFHVAGFWPALLGALVIALSTVILNTLTGSGETRIDLRHVAERRPVRRDPPSDDGPSGRGPIIDV
jgi:putative membrane protein